MAGRSVRLELASVFWNSTLSDTWTMRGERVNTSRCAKENNDPMDSETPLYQINSVHLSTLEVCGIFNGNIRRRQKNVKTEHNGK